MCPDRRLDLRWPRSHPRQTTKTSLMPFSAGATEGKFAHRTSQNHAQAQSSAKSTPTPQNRSAPPTTGRPCASPSPSLRSTSASAWAALSPQRRVRSRHPRKAGNCTEPTEAQPPHSCERLTRLRPAVHTPDGAGIGAGHVPRFSLGFVHVSGPALAGCSFQERRRRQDHLGRTPSVRGAAGTLDV